MSAYLIEVADTKQGVIYPTIVGPFDTVEAANAFAEQMAMGEAAQAGQGGYSAVHVISDETCDYTPAGYQSAYAWRLVEEDA